MKKFTIAALTLAAAAAAQAQAQDQAYISAAVGQGHVSASCDGATNCKNNGTAYKIAGGYRFGGGLAAELGYMRFGRATANVNGVDAKLEADGPLVALAYLADLNSDWGVGARLGIVSMKTKVTGSFGGASASDSETKAKPYVGLSVSYALAKSTHLELSADFSRAEYAGETASVRAIMIGLRQSF